MASSAAPAPSTPGASTTSTTTRTTLNGVNLHLHYGDISATGNLLDLIYNIRPDEIYHLAAQSHVRVSFDMPEYTGDITGLGTMRILEAIRKSGIEVPFLPGILQRDVRQRQAAAE